MTKHTDESAGGPGETLVKDLASLARFAETFVRERPQGAIVGLTGDLGAGKTTFVRACIAAIAKASGVPVPRVTSPSFVLHQRYAGLRPPVDHFDLYRLERADETALLELGYQETVDQAREARGFVFIEWPERAEPRGILSLDVTFHIGVRANGARSFGLRE